VTSDTCLVIGYGPYLRGLSFFEGALIFKLVLWQLGAGTSISQEIK